MALTKGPYSGNTIRNAGPDVLAKSADNNAEIEHDDTTTPPNSDDLVEDGIYDSVSDGSEYSNKGNYNPAYISNDPRAQREALEGIKSGNALHFGNYAGAAAAFLSKHHEARERKERENTYGRILTYQLIDAQIREINIQLAQEYDKLDAIEEKIANLEEKIEQAYDQFSDEDRPLAENIVDRLRRGEALTAEQQQRYDNDPAFRRDIDRALELERERDQALEARADINQNIDNLQTRLGQLREEQSTLKNEKVSQTSSYLADRNRTYLNTQNNVTAAVTFPEDSPLNQYNGQKTLVTESEGQYYAVYGSERVLIETPEILANITAQLENDYSFITPEELERRQASMETKEQRLTRTENELAQSKAFLAEAQDWSESNQEQIHTIEAEMYALRTLGYGEGYGYFDELTSQHEKLLGFDQEFSAIIKQEELNIDFHENQIKYIDQTASIYTAYDNGLISFDDLQKQLPPDLVESFYLSVGATAIRDDLASKIQTSDYSAEQITAITEGTLKFIPDIKVIGEETMACVTGVCQSFNSWWRAGDENIAGEESTTENESLEQPAPAPDERQASVDLHKNDIASAIAGSDRTFTTDDLAQLALERGIPEAALPQLQAALVEMNDPRIQIIDANQTPEIFGGDGVHHTIAEPTGDAPVIEGSNNMPAAREGSRIAEHQREVAANTVPENNELNPEPTGPIMQAGPSFEQMM